MDSRLTLEAVEAMIAEQRRLAERRLRGRTDDASRRGRNRRGGRSRALRVGRTAASGEPNHETPGAPI
jgi:hypothetical protein